MQAFRREEELQFYRSSKRRRERFDQVSLFYASNLIWQHPKFSKDIRNGLCLCLRERHICGHMVVKCEQHTYGLVFFCIRIHFDLIWLV